MVESRNLLCILIIIVKIKINTLVTALQKKQRKAFKTFPSKNAFKKLIKIIYKKKTEAYSLYISSRRSSGEGFCFLESWQAPQLRKQRRCSARRSMSSNANSARSAISLSHSPYTYVDFLSIFYCYICLQITERLRDPRGLRKGGGGGGSAAAAPRNFAANGARPRGFTRPVIDQLALFNFNSIACQYLFLICLNSIFRQIGLMWRINLLENAGFRQLLSR